MSQWARTVARGLIPDAGGYRIHIELDVWARAYNCGLDREQCSLLRTRGDLACLALGRFFADQRGTSTSSTRLRIVVLPDPSLETEWNRKKDVVVVCRSCAALDGLLSERDYYDFLFGCIREGTELNGIDWGESSFAEAVQGFSRNRYTVSTILDSIEVGPSLRIDMVEEVSDEDVRTSLRISGRQGVSAVILSRLGPSLRAKNRNPNSMTFDGSTIRFRRWFLSDRPDEKNLSGARPRNDIVPSVWLEWTISVSSDSDSIDLKPDYNVHENL